MSSLLNKVLDFVGWEAVEEEEAQHENIEPAQPNIQSINSKKQNSKVVSLHTSSQFKVVIMRPENFEDAGDICEHLKSNKPVVINLENLDKDFAQRILDFLSGGVCALDGNVQKVSTGIFVIAPPNVDLMSEFKDELRNKATFPWARWLSMFIIGSVILYIVGIFKWLVIIWVISSWIPNLSENRFIMGLGQVIEPILTPIRNEISKLMNGKQTMIDFSVIVLFLLIYVVELLVSRIFSIGVY